MAISANSGNVLGREMAKKVRHLLAGATGLQPSKSVDYDEGYKNKHLYEYIQVLIHAQESITSSSCDDSF